MTEGPTLLSPDKGDKRTKEVFAVSLQRISGLHPQGLARGMHGVDGAVSGAWMCRAGTVADAATVHVGNRYFWFGNKALLWPGIQGNSLETRVDGGVFIGDRI